METNIHLFQYVEDDDIKTPRFIRLFINGSLVHAGADVTSLSVKNLFGREVNFRDVEVYRYSEIPVTDFFRHDHLSYAELRERYPEITE